MFFLLQQGVVTDLRREMAEGFVVGKEKWVKKSFVVSCFDSFLPILAKVIFLLDAPFCYCYYQSPPICPAVTVLKRTENYTLRYAVESCFSGRVLFFRCGVWKKISKCQSKVWVKAWPMVIVFGQKKRKSNGKVGSLKSACLLQLPWPKKRFCPTVLATTVMTEKMASILLHSTWHGIGHLWFAQQGVVLGCCSRFSIVLCVCMTEKCQGFWA